MIHGPQKGGYLEEEQAKFYEAFYWAVKFAAALWQCGKILFSTIHHSSELQLPWWPSYNLLVMAYYNSSAFRTLAQAFSRVIVATCHEADQGFSRTVVSNVLACQLIFILIMGTPLIVPLLTHSLPFFLMYVPLLCIPALLFCAYRGLGVLESDKMLPKRVAHPLRVLVLLISVIILTQTSTSVMVRVYAGEVNWKDVSASYMKPPENDFKARTFRSTWDCGGKKLSNTLGGRSPPDPLNTGGAFAPQTP